MARTSRAKRGKRAASGDGPAEGALRFMRRLLAVDHAVQACSKRMQARCGITAPQRLLVRTVGRKPGISAGEVAVAMEVDPSTITPILARLERENVIERIVDPVDRRRALLRLRPRGKKIDALRAGTVEAAITRALGRISNADRAAAERVLAIVTQELERTS